MIIDPTKSLVPWQHKIRIGAAVVELLSPHEAVAIDLPATRGPEIAELRAAVAGLLPEMARGLVEAVPASHLPIIVAEYQALAQSWMAARAEVTQSIANLETANALRALGGRAASSKTGKADEAATAPASGPAPGPGPGQGSRSRAIELEVVPGEPLPQPLAALATKGADTQEATG